MQTRAALNRFENCSKAFFFLCSYSACDVNIMNFSIFQQSSSDYYSLSHSSRLCCMSSLSLAFRLTLLCCATLWIWRRCVFLGRATPSHRPLTIHFLYSLTFSILFSSIFTSNIHSYTSIFYSANIFPFNFSKCHVGDVCRSNKSTMYIWMISLFE